VAPDKDVRAFIGLGGNVGNRLSRLRRAVQRLKDIPLTRVHRLSPVYETSPVGPRQRRFLNAVVELRTALPPSVLLRALKGLEEDLGRRRRRRWGPREIDLDILYYGSRVVRKGDLRIPHPERLKRRFVLVPLADIAPRFQDPVAERPLAALSRRLTAPDQRIRLFRETL
jgi:2-amino-4-hydroxy-6-hydroxymethyldihydropteridine diphosphokinase